MWIELPAQGDEALLEERYSSAKTRPRIGWYRYNTPTRVLKRAIDIVLSCVLLVLLAPVLLVIASAVRLTSPGPALFRQTRVGFAEEPFTILKFRTMHVDNDESVHRQLVTAMLDGSLSSDSDGVDSTGKFKLVNDPRVTPLGAWLRRTSLDELPQLLNVLRGEMSLVGPRPSLYYEVNEYEPRYRLRATSMPGMTGLWQVEGRSDMHMRDALDLDLEYVEDCSLGKDMRILARTVRVFTSKNAA